METAFNSPIPGYFTNYSRPLVQTGSRRFLVLLSVILSLSCCSLMFSALIGADRYLVYLADISFTNAAIVALGASGVSGALGGVFSSITLLVMRS